MAGGIARTCYGRATVAGIDHPRSPWRRLVAGMACVLFLVGLSASARAVEAELSKASFDTWLAAFTPSLAGKGISQATTARAFSGLTPNNRILALLTNQPEHSRSAGSYVSALVSKRRITAGREKLVAHGALLKQVAQRFGVEPSIVLAIWGVETSFGRIRGKTGVIRSLATLAAGDPRRTKFWTKELVAALQILEARDVEVANMTGSWAGAMGHTQFMPTTYHAFAVDFDGDGRRDIWNSLADSLASTAHYLKKSGWTAGQPWGFEVVLPNGFDFSRAGPGVRGDLASWRKRGVLLARGPGWPRVDGDLQLVLPAGARGPAFLVTKNFKAIKRYNPSTLYALAVAQLADSIAGAPGLYTDWPSDDVALSRSERIELQQLLSVVNYDVGKADGIIGRKTRAAIFAVQKTLGLAPDGHANKTLLLRLRSVVGARRATGTVAESRI